MFSSLTLYHILVRVPMSCLQEGGKYSGGGITLYLLGRRQTTSAARHLLPFSPADRRAFGVTVHELIQPWPGSDKAQGAQHVKVSQKHLEMNNSSCYRTAQQKNTKLHTFLSHNMHFSHTLFPELKEDAKVEEWAFRGSCRVSKMEIAIPKDVDLHQGLKLCKKKLMVINAHCLSWIQTLFHKSVLALSLQITLRFHECWYLN